MLTNISFLGLKLCKTAKVNGLNVLVLVAKAKFVHKLGSTERVFLREKTGLS